jgi:hypothetical protein
VILAWPKGGNVQTEREFEAALAIAQVVIHILETDPELVAHEKLGKVTYAVLATLRRLQQPLAAESSAAQLMLQTPGRCFR